MKTLDFENVLQEQTRFQNKEWLVIGKGPTFEKVCQYPLDNYVTVGLNHIARESIVTHLDFLHIFDIDVLEQYDISLLDKVDYLLMPQFPNETYQLPLLKGVFHRLSQKETRDYSEGSSSGADVLYQFLKQQRLVTYPRGTKTSTNDIKTGIRIGSFSGSTVINCLAAAHVTHIKTIGIDGGNDYASKFNDLKDKTLLTGGATTFNSQFSEMALTRNAAGLSIKLLNEEDMPVIYVGAQKEQYLAHKVLEYSIDTTSSLDVKILHLGDILKDDQEFLASTMHLPSCTPFSMQRFAIPKLNNYQGKAIYIDSDMQVFQDIRELANVDLGDASYSACQVDPKWGRQPQLSVLVIDCAKVRWDITSITNQLRTGELSYQDLFLNGPEQTEVARIITKHWNSLESYNEKHTRLIHYTSMKNQPWLSINNPSAMVWCKALIDAIEAEYICEQLVAEHIDKGWVRPSLAWQIQHKVPDPMLMPNNVIAQDKNFTPPHMYSNADTFKKIAGLGESVPSGSQLFFRMVLARLRVLYFRTGFSDISKKIIACLFKIKRALSTGIKIK